VLSSPARHGFGREFARLGPQNMRLVLADVQADALVEWLRN
jgi:hypothetical protein